MLQARLCHLKDGPTPWHHLTRGILINLEMGEPWGGSQVQVTVSAGLGKRPPGLKALSAGMPSQGHESGCHQCRRQIHMSRDRLWALADFDITCTCWLIFQPVLVRPALWSHLETWPTPLLGVIFHRSGPHAGRAVAHCCRGHRRTSQHEK